MQVFNVPEQALKALQMIHSANCEAYFVGGCVRDIIMAKTPQDWDINTSAAPEHIARIFADYRLIETGLKHGTVTVIVDRLLLEITTFRRDGDYSDNRRPDRVEFTKILGDDLARRDFTMNAICWDGEKIVDLHGGQDDIKANIIKCVGDANKRFNEDALRILRALRFAAVLGFKIENKTGRAIYENRELLRNISKERILAELTDLLCGKNAASVLGEYTDIIAVIMPEILPCVGFEQKNKYHHLTVWEHTLAVIEASEAKPIMRYTALMHDIGKPCCFFLDEKGVGHFYGHTAKSAEIAVGIMRRLTFDKHSRETVETLIRSHMDDVQPNKKSLKRLLAKYGKYIAVMLLSFKKADNTGQAEMFRHRLAELDECIEIMKQIIAEKECFSLKDLAVNGNDIMALGINEGKQTGALLTFLLNAVIDERAENDKDKLIAYLKNSGAIV